MCFRFNTYHCIVCLARVNSTSSPGGRTSNWLHKTHTLRVRPRDGPCLHPYEALKRDESEEDERAIGRVSVKVSWFSGFPQEHSNSAHSRVCQYHFYYCLLFFTDGALFGGVGRIILGWYTPLKCNQYYKRSTAKCSWYSWFWRWIPAESLYNSTGARPRQGGKRRGWWERKGRCLSTCD